MDNKKKNFKIFLIKGIWKNLTSRRRKQLIVLPILIIFTGISEMFSIASVIPFLSALSKPEKANEILAFNGFFKFFETINISDPFFISISIFLICVSVAGCLRLLTIFSINFFSAAVGSDFSKKAYRLSLNQPYEIHIKRNSSCSCISLLKGNKNEKNDKNRLRLCLWAKLQHIFFYIARKFQTLLVSY